MEKKIKLICPACGKQSITTRKDNISRCTTCNWQGKKEETIKEN